MKLVLKLFGVVCYYTIILIMVTMVTFKFNLVGLSLFVGTLILIFIDAYLEDKKS